MTGRIGANRCTVFAHFLDDAGIGDIRQQQAFDVFGRVFDHIAVQLSMQVHHGEKRIQLFVAQFAAFHKLAYLLIGAYRKVGRQHRHKNGVSHGKHLFGEIGQ